FCVAERPARHLRAKPPPSRPSPNAHGIRWPHDSSTLPDRANLNSLVALNRERDSVAAAEAERRDAALKIAALQFVKQGNEDACTTRANRVANRHCAAVHIHFFRIQFQ